MLTDVKFSLGQELLKTQNLILLTKNYLIEKS